MELNRSTRTCFVQTHHTNLREGDLDPFHYCVGPLQASGLFDHIVLAAADMPENRVVEEYARLWGVDWHLGAPLDMTKRMLEVADKTGASSLVRVLVDWFYVDPDLVAKMSSHLESNGFDYVGVPFDFDMKFGCDVHSVHGLREVAALMDERPDLREKNQFRPWQMIEANAEGRWSVDLFEDTPAYSNEFFWKMKRKIEEHCPIAWDFGPTFFHHAYEHAVEVIPENSDVLDLACGWGNGTEILARHSRSALGIDICESYVEEAQRRSKAPNASYRIGDAMALDLADDSVDAVVSIHTMEHVKDDELFLSEMRRVLRPGGLLVLEVPLRMRRPFIHNDEPFMQDHEREYAVGPVKELVERFFDIEKQFGVSRGYYADIGRARNAVAFDLRMRS